MIFSRRGGLAVVEVRSGICQGCRMRVPPALQPDPAQRRGDPLPELPAACSSTDRDPCLGSESEASVGRRWIVRKACRGRRSRRGNLKPFSHHAHAPHASPRRDALRLRKVCRAGFAGRGTPLALCTRLHARCPSTRDRVSVGLRRRRSVSRILSSRPGSGAAAIRLAPGCPGDRATDPRERTAARAWPRGQTSLLHVCSRWGLPSVRPHERTW